MLDFASGVGALRRVDSLRALAVGAPNLADLICLLMVEEAEGIIRAGILQDYVIREEPISVVRGRLLAGRQARRHYGQLDELECRYDEYETDVLENRIVAAGLEAAYPVCSDAPIGRRVRRCRAAFLDVCRPAGSDDLDAATYRLEYGQRNSRCQAAHQWALLLLQRRYVEDLYLQGQRSSFAFLLDMNVLFERYVARLVETSCHGRGLSVDVQRSRSSIIVDAATGQSYSSVRPDVVLRYVSDSVNAARPLDTKYKLYDGRKVDPSDIYQCLLYSYAFTDHIDLAERRAVLVYPSKHTAERSRVRVQTVGGGRDPHSPLWASTSPRASLGWLLERSTTLGLSSLSWPPNDRRGRRLAFSLRQRYNQRRCMKARGINKLEACSGNSQDPGRLAIVVVPGGAAGSLEPLAAALNLPIVSVGMELTNSEEPPNSFCGFRALVDGQPCRRP